MNTRLGAVSHIVPLMLSCSQEQEESSRHLHSQREGSDGASPSLRSIMLRPSHLSESKLRYDNTCMY